MNNLVKLSFIGALTLFSSVQAADIDTVTVTPAQRELLSSHHYSMQADEFYQFKGAYALSNGMTLTMYNEGSFLYARLNDQLGERIVANSDHTFSAKNSGMKMRINLLENGEANGEVVLPATIIAANSHDSERLYTVAILR